MSQAADNYRIITDTLSNLKRILLIDDDPAHNAKRVQLSPLQQNVITSLHNATHPVIGNSGVVNTGIDSTISMERGDHECVQEGNTSEEVLRRHSSPSPDIHIELSQEECRVRNDEGGELKEGNDEPEKPVACKESDIMSVEVDIMKEEYPVAVKEECELLKEEPDVMTEKPVVCKECEAMNMESDVVKEECELKEEPAVMTEKPVVCKECEAMNMESDVVKEECELLKEEPDVMTEKPVVCKECEVKNMESDVVKEECELLKEEPAVMTEKPVVCKEIEVKNMESDVVKEEHPVAVTEIPIASKEYEVMKNEPSPWKEGPAVPIDKPAAWTNAIGEEGAPVTDHSLSLEERMEQILTTMDHQISTSDQARAAFKPPRISPPPSRPPPTLSISRIVFVYINHRGCAVALHTSPHA